MQSSSTQIKAVLFDLGETLLNFGRINPNKVFLESSRASYDYLKDKKQPAGNFTYYCMRNFLSIRWHYLISRIWGNDFDSLKLLKKLGKKNHIELNEQQWEELAWLWYKPLSKLGRVEDGIEKTLSSLTDMGLKLGILSNTFIHRSCLERHLEQEGILNFLPVRLYSYEFDYKKPDTRIFRQAAERIGENIRSIMFVGDRIDKDIKPALEVGMAAALKDAYTNYGKDTPKGAGRVNKLCELVELISRLNKHTLE